ncbi:tripartite tricarboxylate transporter permease [Nitrospinota bacterium]
MVDQILEGIALALTWKGLVMVAVGVFGGITVGAIPGLTGVMAIAVLIPFSFFMPPVLGIPFLLGIHKGALFGGSIPAIMVNTPGTAPAAATCLDGYPLAQRGEAKSAIQMALYSSTLGDTFSDIALIVAALPLAALALLFGPAEFFALLLMGLTIISTVTGSSVVRGLLAALMGVLIGLVGDDTISGAERFSFGIANLEGGVGLVPLLIGLFAISEVLIQAEKKVSVLSRPPESAHLKGGRPLPLRELRNSARTILRSSIIGTIVGAIPGAGASIATFVGYGAAKRASRRPEEFGKGSYEGVAAAEAANSAVAGADLIPTLAFGIPGGGTAAVLMGAFIAQGLRPGPSLFQEHAPTMYAIFTLLLLGNPIMLIEGWLLSGLFARLVTIRQSIMVPAIFLSCIVGAIIFRNDLGDVTLALVAGLFGYALRKLGFPMAPLIIAFILTPRAEEALKQALILSEGDLMIFFSRPIAALFMGLSGLILVMSVRKRSSLDPSRGV